MIWNLTKTEKDKAQLTIYGPIRDFSSWFSGSGTSPQKVMQDLDELDKVKEFTIRINSGGGSAFAGLAIFEIIRAHGAKVNVHVDGVAASAASIIAMAGDRIIMGTGAMMMLHNPWMSVEGNAKELREAADVLDKVGESLINVYMSRTSKSREELRAMLEKTTWMTADEAVAKGFADEVDRKTRISASIQGEYAVFNGEKFALNYFPTPPELPVQAETPEKPPALKAPNAQTRVEPKNENEEGEETVKDVVELQAKYPDIFKAAVIVGVDQERARITELNTLADAPGATDIVAKAITDGGTAAQAAMDIVKASKDRLTNEGKKRQADANASGITNVKPDEAPDKPGKPDEAAESQAEADLIAAEVKNLMGGKN